VKHLVRKGLHPGKDEKTALLPHPTERLILFQRSGVLCNHYGGIEGEEHVSSKRLFRSSGFGRGTAGEGGGLVFLKKKSLRRKRTGGEKERLGASERLYKKYCSEAQNWRGVVSRVEEHVIAGDVDTAVRGFNFRQRSD